MIGHAKDIVKYGNLHHSNEMELEKMEYEVHPTTWKPDRELESRWKSRGNRKSRNCCRLFPFISVFDPSFYCAVQVEGLYVDWIMNDVNNLYKTAIINIWYWFKSANVCCQSVLKDRRNEATGKPLQFILKNYPISWNS